MESILELRIPSEREILSSNALDYEEQPTYNAVQLPIVYKRNKDKTLNTHSVYESLAISSVVVHEGALYRFRMPGAKSKVGKSMKVTVNDGVSERTEQNGVFDHRIPHILRYKRSELEKSGVNTVPKAMLDPSLSESNTRSSVTHVPNMDGITLDCFAIELGGSSHYLIYIAGQWFISFSNFFKFFSEDYRRKNLDTIAKGLKKMRGKDFCVRKEELDSLIYEVYPVWAGYNENRKKLFGKDLFYDMQRVKNIIGKHMTNEDNNNISPFPETQWGRGAGSRFDELKKKIMKNIDKAFWKYVSIRPVWNTKERFDALFEGMDLDPTEFYQHVPIKPRRTTFGPQVTTSVEDRIFSDVSYTKVKAMVPDIKTLETYMKSYAVEFLEKMHILPEDIPSIVDSFFRGTTDFDKSPLTLKELQQSMQLQADLKPGKFDLLLTLAKAAGVTPNADSSVEYLKKELEKAKTDLRVLTIRRKALADFIENPIEEETVSNDAPYFAQLTKEAAEEEMQNIDQKIDEMTKKDKISLLKREIHALSDPEWAAMNHVLEHVGVKASNRSSVKNNVVFTLEEFDHMIQKFSGEGDDTALKKQLQEKKTQLEKLETHVNKDAIKKEITALESVFDETHINCGEPDKIAPVSTRTMPPAQLDSKQYFRGDKGKKLDMFIKKWMSKKCPDFKFGWDNSPNTYGRYGATHNSEKWIKLRVDLARENTLETTYLTLLHEIGHALTPFIKITSEDIRKYNLTSKPKILAKQAEINHGPEWFKTTKKLFKEYFAEKNEIPFREPAQFHTHVAWKRVKQVMREKTTRTIYMYYFDQRARTCGPSFEIVNYNPADYTDINYGRIDPYGMRKALRLDKIKILNGIEKLKGVMIRDKKPDTKYMKRLKEDIKEIKAQLDLNASKYNKDINVKIFVKLAKYIREKVPSTGDTEMVTNICNLYSATSDFKAKMKTIIDESKIKDDTDWVSKTNDIRSFHKYMEALVSIHYVSDRSDRDTIRARTSERSLNGIPIALRYAMFMDGVPVDQLPEATFEKLKKFGKKVRGKTITQDDLFKKKGTKQIGLYDKTEDTLDMPKSEEEYTLFRAKAQEILHSDYPFDRPRRQRPRTSTLPKTSEIIIYDTLPDFLKSTKAAIKDNQATKPTTIPGQKAAECGLHAVNNLLGSNYTIENFQRIQGTKYWFRDQTLELVLGNTGLKIDGKWQTDSVKLCFKYNVARLRNYPEHFMKDDNLVGFICFLGPNDAGHWTTMKKWGPDSFTYMDSNKKSGSGGLVLTLPENDMVNYILNEATYGKSKVKTFIAVYKDEDSYRSAKTKLNTLDSDMQGYTDASDGGFADDAAGDDIEDTEDQDKEALINYVMSISSMKSREKIWTLIQNKIRQHAMEIKEKNQSDTPLETFLAWVRDLTLDKKKLFVKIRLGL